MIDALRDLAADLGRTPTTRDINDAEDCPAAQTYSQRFGSLRAARRAAELDPGAGENGRYTDAELVHSIRRWTREHGRVPRSTDAKTDSALPDPNTYRSRFGSWREALGAALLQSAELTEAVADDDGRLALVCEPADRDAGPTVARGWTQRDTFGLVASGLEPNEPVTVRLDDLDGAFDRTPQH